MKRLKQTKKFSKPVIWYETGSQAISSSNIQSLIRNIIKIRKQNGGDLQHGFFDRVQEDICNNPGYASMCEDSGAPSEDKAPVAKHIGRNEVARFLKTVQNFIASGGELVEQDVADKRAKICTTCPNNVPIKGCMGCSGLIPKLLKATKGASTKHDDQLRGCNVCGCQLKAKVHLPKEVANDENEDLKFPATCWLSKE